MKYIKRIITCDICKKEFDINRDSIRSSGCRIRFWKREYKSTSGDWQELDLCSSCYKSMINHCNQHDNNENYTSYYGNVLDFLTSQLKNDRYSSVCFELTTILISRLYRQGYVCSLSNNHWRIEK